MFHKHLRYLLGRLAALLVLGLACGLGLAEVNSEQQLKVAFLVNFLKYIEWPGTGPTATICLFGRDQLGPYLASYEGRSIVGKELRVRRVNGPDQIADCQLVYIPDTEEARVGAVLRWLENKPVLAVSDADLFARQGGGIALVRSEGRLQFDVNADALSRAGLKPSSQMMRLARQVIGGTK
jgi:hypothetical protein